MFSNLCFKYFDPQLVEPMDAEPTDKESRLYIMFKLPTRKTIVSINMLNSGKTRRRLNY